MYFRVSASRTKILNVKNILNTVKNSRAKGMRKLLKNPEFKIIFNTVKNVRANSVFQGERNLLKILNLKVYSIQWKIPGQRASASCSKILNVKSILNTVNLWQLCFSGQAQVAKKSWMLKVHSIQWKISGQTQVAQKSWIWKYIQYSEYFQGKLCFSGQAQVARKSWI